MKAGLSSNFSAVKTVPEMDWIRNLYSKVELDGPATNLDCFTYCFFVQAQVCHFFVLLGQTCHLGRADVTNGTLDGSQPSSTVTLYSWKSKLSLELRAYSDSVVIDRQVGASIC